ncbi:hypothetical protein SAMN06297129_1255 [Pseudooceanicola antarcticus]|uniref:Autotransporter domain-containing protein n=1 Tax=Pseudooceanicola antarcticus TaxID=1247613 RepID=A0A285ILH3_9RHOB|nr:autotransporter outer membrane beta-barrel domain-containing protein [Pseudooceanicola antarcticus]SNY47821.1 hypothetical protein SAMN06297129_1255 [Pseudooceanicola antarcticus]
MIRFKSAFSILTLALLVPGIAIASTPREPDSCAGRTNTWTVDQSTGASYDATFYSPGGESILIEIDHPENIGDLEIYVSADKSDPAPLCSGASCDGARAEFVSDKFSLWFRTKGARATADDAFTVTFSCAATPVIDDEAQASSSALSGWSSDISSAVGNAGTGSGPTADGFFFSTPVDEATDGAPRAWAQISGHNYNGALDGSGVELTLGVDMEISPQARAGLLLSIGKNDFEGADTISYETVTLGAYLNADLKGGDFSAWAAFAKPDVTVNGVSHVATRKGLGLRYSLGKELGAIYLTGFGSLDAASETHPDFTNTRTRGSFGAKATWNHGSDLEPWVSLAVDAQKIDSDGISSSFVKPSLGAGLSYRGANHRLSLRIDYSYLTADTTDTALSLRYSRSF